MRAENVEAPFAASNFPRHLKKKEDIEIALFVLSFINKPDTKIKSLSQIFI